MTQKDVAQQGLLLKFGFVVIALLALTFLSWQGLKAPPEQNNICRLFSSHPAWYWAAQDSQRKWGIPISEQMAFIEKESHFRAAAAPGHRRLLGFIPWSRASSASGYMQALDSTWQMYLHNTHQTRASRSDFSNATDFIGWYLHFLDVRYGVRADDVYHNYLLYHEGPGGYLHRSYLRQPWLMLYAKRVERQARRYHAQLLFCGRRLPKKPWWRFW
tara:strand:- start:357 stop:1004 length:648 start_codon:yes stop_codon:yes gene_type:complete